MTSELVIRLKILEIIVYTSRKRLFVRQAERAPVCVMNVKELLNWLESGEKFSGIVFTSARAVLAVHNLNLKLKVKINHFAYEF